MGRYKQTFLQLLRFIPLLLCLALMGAYLLSGRDVSVESLKSFAPSAPLLAVGFMVILYAFKSLTVVFPIIVLNVLGGFLFSPGWALAVNFLGVAVDLTLPYWIGRLAGADLLYRLQARYPKFEKFFEGGTEAHLFLSFFLRAIFCLPGDLVSMYFGAISTPFGKYMLGSFLGMAPGTVCATLMGISITDPSSALFWISVGLTIGISLVSAVIHYFWKKTHHQEYRVAGRR